MNDYKPVPVAEAKQIAERYDKSIVVIAAWDPVFGLLHTTTYGVSANDKDHAADAGVIVARALGTVPELAHFFEDFRKSKKEGQTNG